MHGKFHELLGRHVPVVVLVVDVDHSLSLRAPYTQALALRSQLRTLNSVGILSAGVHHPRTCLSVALILTIWSPSTIFAASTGGGSGMKPAYKDISRVSQ